ncbi:hypothetical protein [Geobacter sp.]|uniref:hypothetical protein n=1 Tax=Geobacter sp. TaxID=46610 RepID=UPI001ACF28AF|nr:hypothetical protein [Geobacter sp.]CAG1770639.1 hypothetical protein BAC3_01218 [uncultured bacterium]
MKCFKIAINAISAIAAMVAAFLWYKASVVTVKPAEEGVEGDFMITDEDSNNEPYDVIKTGKEQARWNKYAAIAASVAAIFQSVGLLIPE